MNLYKNLERVFSALTNLGKLPRKVIKYGSVFFLVMLVTGLALMLLNSMVFSYSSYLDLVAKSIVKTSFSIAAEVIIGGLILDYVFKK